MAVCISHQKIMSFFGSLKQIWLLSSTNLEFFRFTHTAYFVHLKNSRFVDSRSQILISFTEKTQDFLFEMQTAIIAHQWKSKFSQCTANPAGLQRKTDRKMEKPIALRARSFFPWAKLLVLNFVERKNHFQTAHVADNFVCILSVEIRSDLANKLANLHCRNSYTENSI